MEDHTSSQKPNKGEHTAFFYGMCPTDDWETPACQQLTLL